MPPVLPTIGVLIADPSPVTRDSLAAFLRQLGYEVRTAASTLDALAALVGWTPGVAVIDLGAPDMDGQKVARSLAVSDRPPILIGIVRTGPASNDPSNNLALFDDIFTKAASPEAVAEAIARQIAVKTVHLGSGPAS